MISRWLDDGDRLHEASPAASEPGGELAAHQGRWHAFVEEARSRGHRHRRVVAGAALLGVILLVVAFRHSVRNAASVDATGSETAAAVATPAPDIAPGALAPAAATPPAVTPPAVTAPPVVASAAAGPRAEEEDQAARNAEQAAAPAGAGNPNPSQEPPSAAPTPGTASTPPVAPAAPVAAAEPVAPAAPAATNPAAPPVTKPEAKAEAESPTAADESPRAAVAVADPPRVAAATGETPRVAAPAGEKPADDGTGSAAAPADTAKPRRPEGVARAAAAPAVAPLQGCKSALLRQRARDALENCRQVFASDPRSADAMVLLARADLLAGRPAETLQLAHRAVATNPRHADAYLLIGTVQQTEGRRNEARSAYESYLQLAPLGAHASDVKAILRTL